MASGFGFKFIAFFVTFIMLVVFELLWYIEDKFIKNNRQSEEGEQPS
jgi:uncharacterized membrane protein YhiD involved in acid resistance